MRFFSPTLLSPLTFSIPILKHISKYPGDPFSLSPLPQLLFFFSSFWILWFSPDTVLRRILSSPFPRIIFLENLSHVPSLKSGDRGSSLFGDRRKVFFFFPLLFLSFPLPSSIGKGKFFFFIFKKLWFGERGFFPFFFPLHHSPPLVQKFYGN